MGLEGIGSSVVIALAAVLWLVYLIPTWFRRREYLSTEKNAVRLQQTLRVMAETAEVPASVRAETTARSVAAHQKTLRREFERAKAIERARATAMSQAAARTLATLRPAVASAVVATSPAARRLRRSRAATTAVLAASLVATGIGMTSLAGGLTVLLVAGGATTSAAAVALLRTMASVARNRNRIAVDLRDRPAQPRLVDRPMADFAVEEVREPAWTPVPLPKPLYLSKPPTQPIVSEAALAQARSLLLAEAEEAERAMLEAERAEKVTPIIRPAAASDSRFARMGIVDEAESTVTNLDEVLRRRRAV